MNSDQRALRRGLRAKKLSLKAMESVYIDRMHKKLDSDSSNSESSGNEENLFSDEDVHDKFHKPVVLHENEKIAGEKMFSFQKRKARNSILTKVMEQVPKTPNSVRSKIKKQIVTKILEDCAESETGDYSDSESDVPSEAASSEDDLSKQEKSIENELQKGVDLTETRTNKDGQAGIKTTKMAKLQQAVKKKSDNNYIIKTDDYFMSHSSKKILTSNNTLEKLDTPRLPQDQLHAIMKNIKNSTEHEKSLHDLAITNSANFDKWLYILNENFSILAYGLGCKRHILNEFHKTCLNNHPVIVVNGFFPTLSIKDVLDKIIVDLLEVSEIISNPYEACDLIEQEFSNNANIHLYIIIHNIEGEALRNKLSQDIFSRLACINNIHLIASIDHVNAPLIWDYKKLSKFNFTWWDVTSLRPQIEETSFESSLMVYKSASSALSCLRNIFMSLTVNSKGIYMIIAKHQLENVKSQYYQGLAFKDLYWQCREAFLVSSDLSLRAQLTEFVDHKMVKYKRSVDGTEYLIIPIANTLLKQFLDEQTTN